MQGEGLFEVRGEGDGAILSGFALGDADAAGVQVDVADADLHQFGDADAGVEQGLDEHDVAGTACGPHGGVVAADLGLGGDVGQLLGLVLHLDAEFGAWVPEDLLEVGVVGPFLAQVFGQLAGLALGGGPGRVAALAHCGWWAVRGFGPRVRR
ncbi:hypothetical protein MTP10_33430 [Nonomuraea sp. 3-1Str]|uniref:hypothetical protein n=1 Tax=Nonomuraea sp. 3-1Str TaxID=2929801 RepID=UPI00285E312D|nr:hypothetical protein [Nonomuraea sp. 3-1Str]MDR8413625.1 hypothetical protein [Nonomuraea sp. 3-1Str]